MILGIDKVDERFYVEGLRDRSVNPFKNTAKRVNKRLQRIALTNV